MSQPSTAQFEEQIQSEMALKRARQEAAARETVGIRKAITIIRALGWCGALVPIIGIFAIAIGSFIAFWASVYVGFKGDVNNAIKQVVITFIGAVAAMIVWFVVNFTVIAIFG